jgi:hypothetical protein
MTKNICLEANHESYHYIYKSVINKQKAFYDDFDRYQFMKLSRQAKEKFNLKFLAFCLTNNQYHLLVQTNKINLSKTMEYIEDRYKKYFRQKYQLQKNPSLKFLKQNKENIQEDLNHISRVLDYIHLKPVNEGFCQHPEHFRWSSYLSYKNHQDYFDLLNLEELKNYFQRYSSNDLVQVQNHIQWSIQSKSKTNTLINSKAMKEHLSEYKVDYSTYKKLFAYCLLEWTELDSLDLENELQMQASSIRELKNNVKFEIEDNNQLLENLIYNVRKNFGLF